MRSIKPESNNKILRRETKILDNKTNTQDYKSSFKMKKRKKRRKENRRSRRS